ncbi:hypothetical protein Aperf_G00000111915 [Anoplocephala perfoliata]
MSEFIFRSVSMVEGPVGRSVILPVHDSYICHRAFKWFMKHVYQPNDIIYFAHVMHSTSDYHNLFSALEGTPTDLSSRNFPGDYSEANDLVQKYRKLAEDANVKYCSEILTGASVTDAILHFAAERQADLIVVPTRGPKTLKRTLVGDLSRHLVARSTVPLLVVPPVSRTRTSSST